MKTHSTQTQSHMGAFLGADHMAGDDAAAAVAVLGVNAHVVVVVGWCGWMRVKCCCERGEMMWWFVTYRK